MTNSATNPLRRAIEAARTGLDAASRALAQQVGAYTSCHGGYLRVALYALAAVLDWIGLYWALTGAHELAIAAALISIALKAAGSDLTCRVLRRVRRGVITFRSR